MRTFLLPVILLFVIHTAARAEANAPVPLFDGKTFTGWEGVGDLRERFTVFSGISHPDTRGAKTLREQLALHSGKGSCAACHAKFDPYGFALESFDVMGNHRTSYRQIDSTAPKGKSQWKDGLPVDSTGVTPDGKAFAGVQELRAMLAKQPDQLARGVTRHLLTYATGQPATPLDQSTIEAIVKGAAKDDYGLRSLVHGIVQSETFRSK